MDIKELISQMTFHEKVAQLEGVIFPYGDENFPVKIKEDGSLTNEKEFDEATKDGIGGIAYVNMGLQKDKSVKWVNALQKNIIEKSRFGIPALFFEEALFGHISLDATEFPLPVGMAASFDEDLVSRINDCTGQEIRARGSNMTFNPVMDIGRDPRNGRIQETYGEDTFLSGKMGAAAVRGLQGGDDVHTDHIAATLKHFAGYGQTIGGRQAAPSEMCRRTFVDEILESFRLAVDGGNPAGVMTSYSEYDGVPLNADKKILTDILRKQWGFGGVVVSDFGAVEYIYDNHRLAATMKDAGLKALDAGVDMDLPAGTAFEEFDESVEKNAEIMARIDEAVERVLTLKKKLGLFENPYADEEKCAAIINCEEFRKISLEASEKSMVLVKNDNATLPLKSKKNIAVIGPHATSDGAGLNILEAFEQVTDVKWAHGCSLTDNDKVLGYLEETKEKGFVELHHESFTAEGDESRALTAEEEKERDRPHLLPLEVEEGTIEEAVSLAKESDVVVMCLGESDHCQGENYAPNRYCDRDDLELIGNQLELLKRVRATGAKVVTVISTGRPLALEKVAELSDAVLIAWTKGERRAEAIVNTVFGDNNPGGKLCMTFPKSVGQIPCHYSQKPTGYMNDYAFKTGKYMYPFGYGLSYTTFEYQDVSVSAGSMSADGGEVTVSVELKNTGDCYGEEVVLVYVRDVGASVIRPIKLLKGFKRVGLESGETKTVDIVLRSKDMCYMNIDEEFVCEPRNIEIMVDSFKKVVEII